MKMLTKVALLMLALFALITPAVHAATTPTPGIHNPIDGRESDSRADVPVVAVQSPSPGLEDDGNNHVGTPARGMARRWAASGNSRAR